MSETSWSRRGAVSRPLERLWSHFEAPSAILSHLGTHLGISKALLGPFQAILNVSTTSGTPRPSPGEGSGGVVTPPPKGNK
eukprot:2549777-Pyramimonas_sp.AAC.1